MDANLSPGVDDMRILQSQAEWQPQLGRERRQRR